MAKLSAKQVKARDAKRDIGAELLQAVRDMKAGKVGAVHHVELAPIAEARVRLGLSQSQFAALLGVSVRTLQEWEQGRRAPSGAAMTLLRIAERHPEVLKELVTA